MPKGHVQLVDMNHAHPNCGTSAGSRWQLVQGGVVQAAKDGLDSLGTALAEHPLQHPRPCLENSAGKAQVPAVRDAARRVKSGQLWVARRQPNRQVERGPYSHARAQGELVAYQAPLAAPRAVNVFDGRAEGAVLGLGASGLASGLAIDACPVWPAYTSRVLARRRRKVTGKVCTAARQAARSIKGVATGAATGASAGAAGGGRECERWSDAHIGAR